MAKQTTLSKEKLDNIRKPNNIFATILKVLAVVSIFIGLAMGSVYADNAGGFMTFFMTFLIGLIVAFILYVAAEIITILHDIRRKMYVDNIK